MRTRPLTYGAMAGLASVLGLVLMLRPGPATMAQVQRVRAIASQEIPLPQPPDDPTLAIAPADPLMPAPFEPASLPSSTSDADPMQEVEVFVQQGRQQATGKIEALTREAETLRARLAKVEGALERWKAVAGALERGQDASSAPPAVEQLEPVPLPTDREIEP